MVEPANKAIATVGTTGELRQLGAGTVLGRYTLVRRIASGGMAEVYAARSQGISGFEKKVAIKKILPQYSLNRRFIDMLVDEAKITVSLTHPNIAQVYELGLEGDTYYIVMEYVDGRPLNRLLQKIDSRGHRTIPIEHTVHVMVEVTKGLHHAHNQRDSRGEPLSIVHRDISPQNVLIAYTGDVKLIDFGIARAQGRAAQTSVGVIKGKLRYLAPEIARGEEPDHRSDIFCCGIVLFELLTGEAMFAPRTDVEAIELASQAKVRSPRISNPEVPPELDEIVMRALVKDREARYQSAKALYTDLRRFLNQYYPAYVGSELGDYMQQLFTVEMDEERRLDALAEKVIEEAKPRVQDVSTLPGAEESDELVGLAGGRSSGYQQIVTRAAIDSGRVVAEDLSDEDSRPITGAITMPGDQVPLEPPTAIGPPAKARSRGETIEDDNTDATLAARSASVTVQGQLAPREPSSAGVRFGARAMIAVIPVLAGIGLLGLAQLNPSEPPIPALPPQPELAAAIPAEQTPRETIGQTALLVLEVSPSTPVDVEIEGVLKVESAKPPVRLEVAARPGPQRIVVRAKNYQPKETQKVLAPGNETMMHVALDPITGEIVLEGAEEGSITTDAGKIEGNRITGVPVGTTVNVKVMRAYGRVWSERVEVTKSDPIVLEVPKAAPLAKGTLEVNTRPFSQVFIGDRLKGSTPFQEKLAPGTYKLTLKRPDGQSVTKTITIKPGKKLTLVHQFPR